MPSAHALSVTLLVCVALGLVFSFTIIGTIAEGIAFLALLGLVGRRIHEARARKRPVT